MARPTSVRFDLRMGQALERAAKQEDRRQMEQVRHYVRRGLVADGYYDLPENQEAIGSDFGSTSDPDSSSN